MRAFSACLSVFLGLGVCYISACSSDSDAGGNTAGDAGETSSAGSSGKAGGSNSSGAPGAAGVPGAAGAPEAAAGAAGAPGSTCPFDSDACTSCLQTKCAPSLGACANATDCAMALSGLEPCACGGDMTALMCETTFLGDGGDKAQPLVDCFNTNCAAVCGGM